MKAAPWMLGCLFVGLVGGRAVAADSDTLKVKDNLTPGVNKSNSRTEAEEAGGMLTLTIPYPGGMVLLGPNENGKGMDSDTLKIDPFNITLKSDPDVSGVGELATEPAVTLDIIASVTSDVTISGLLVSDLLVVADKMGGQNVVPIDAQALTEVQESSGPPDSLKKKITYPGKTIDLGAAEKGGKSDTLTIPAFDITLTSDADPPASLPDKAEPPAVWDLTITASSDAGGVPEPSTWAMMLLGFAGLGFAGYWRSRKDRGAQATA